jgi:hypothetical protein
MKKEDFKSIYLENRNAWRIWLKENHVSEKNIWLKILKSKVRHPAFIMMKQLMKPSVSDG